MKLINLKFLIFLLILSIFLISLSNAAKVTLSKQTYQPGESLQAEISGNFSKDISYADINFYKENTKKSLIYDIIKFENIYYIYALLPEEAGSYSMKIENALYYENNELKGDTITKDFNIEKSANFYYLDLISKARISWPIDVKKHAEQLLALYYYNELAGFGTDSLIDKSKEDMCWPSQTCKVEDTALAYTAIAKSDAEKAKKIKDWLLDAQNNFNLGTWQLVVESPEVEQCEIKIIDTNDNRYLDTQTANIASGTSVFDLNLEKKEKDIEIILLYCDVATNVKLSHEYKGIKHDFQIEKQFGIYNRTFNNEKCFGKEYRTDCNSEASANALFFLNQIEDYIFGVIWLKENAKTIKQKAIAYYILGEDDLKSELLNLRLEDGSFPVNDGSLISDKESTLFAWIALKKHNQNATKTTSWLKDNMDFYNNLLALYYVHPVADVKPALSINPGFIIATDNFNVNIENKGPETIILDVKFLEQTQTISLEPGKTKAIEFNNIETDKNFSKLKIFNSANTISYEIPVFIYGKGAGPVSSILNRMQLAPEEINLTLLKDDKTMITLKLKNIGQNAIENISFSYPLKFDKIIKLLPERIEKINSSEFAYINLTIDAKELGNFSGALRAISKNIFSDINLNIKVTENASEKNIAKAVRGVDIKCSTIGIICKENEKCSETTVQTEEGACCPTTALCEKRKKGVNKVLIGIVLLIVIAAVVGYILLKVKKGPKKEDIFKKIEEKYKHRTTKTGKEVREEK